MLTGTYPAENGLLVNARGRLTEATPSMAQFFQEHGYRTGGFTSIIVLHEYYGLDQGFDVYNSSIGADDFHSSAHGHVARDGAKTCDEALAWLRAGGDKPFFAWVHFFDPHAPFTPPAPFDTQLEDPYDGEIAYVDTQVARLLDWLEESGLRERTLVVLTADHGESLGEHGEDEHGLFIYSATTHVPLIFNAPGVIPAGIVAEAPVSLVTLLPTVLEIMQWPTDVDLSEESIAGAWRGTEWNAPLVYCESEYPRLGYGWSALQSVVTEDWMFIESPVPELYDRKRDPNETTNVFEANADIAEQLRKRLKQREAEMQPREHVSLTPDGDLSSALAGIGYVQTSSPDLVPEDGRDPKAMAAVANDYMHALMLLRESKRPEATAILERLVVQSPESDAIHAALGRLYYEGGQYEEAVRELTLSFRTDPQNVDTLFAMGVSLVRLNQRERASETFRGILEIDPSYGQAHSQLGALAAGQGNFAQARTHFEEFVRVAPRSTSALCNLGSIKMQLGECKSAAPHLLAALRVDAECVQAHVALWQTVLLGCTTREQAVRELRSALGSHPDNDQLASRLAWAIATNRQATAEEKLEALELASRLPKSTPDDWFGQDALSVAFAANGHFPKAIAAATRAELLSRTQNPGAKQLIERRLQAFRAGQRYIE